MITSEYQMNNDRQPTASYRLAIASRITAAILGGYALATLFSIALAGLPAVHRADSVLAALLLSFAIYTAAILWAFAARSAWFAWLGLLVPAVLSGVLIWLLR